MKRVVAITIVMVMVTTLFAFSVYAETPVQPLQVITYSDTTTNVRISGTAERLHYNIDSFQVVFMNPPNNYGTSCTPVLVSFRFYNASDIPAYVGQPEFELTATTSTGSVNTIIYGYDQISTDLFVAESSYSTAEVGRIGIGASNDFAYYTGFVIPPRTSLYFSCIIYVNASAYAQNNTGASEDINQVTLSSLNLYTNQISFSADYPYHGEPIDFSSIIDAIENLSSTVSTSSELQQLIAAVSYSGPNYSASYSSMVNDSNFASVSNTRLYTSLARYIYPSVIETLDYELNTSNDQLVSYTLYKYHIVLLLYNENLSNSTYSVPYYLRVANVLPTLNGNIKLSIGDINVVSDLYTTAVIASSGLLQLIPSHTYGNNNNSLLPIGRHYSIITFDLYSPVLLSVWPTFNVGDYYTDVTAVDEYEPTNIFQLLKDLYSSLTKSDSEDNTDQAEDMNDEIHEQEQTWYDNNSDALEAVGLSNYHFSQSQSSGIYTAVTQFQAIWNALGQWTNVYIFILILSISTYIIRHEPTTRVKQFRSSVQAERAERISYYGRKNAEARASNGTTLKSVIRRRK